MKEITFQGKTLHYVIERKNIKHAYFRAKDGYMHVTANKHISEAKIIYYIEQKFDVFYQRLEQRKKLTDHNTLYLWGKPYQVHVKTGKFQYHIIDQEIWIKRPLSKEQTFIRDILKKEMLKHLPSLLQKIEYQMTIEHIPLCAIELKYLKSKFGSYHRKKHKITLNTYLATLDPIYLTYVIYHEYAHAVVFNHSKAFYQVLDRWMPNHKHIQKDLKKIAII